MSSLFPARSPIAFNPGAILFADVPAWSVVPEAPGGPVWAVPLPPAAPPGVESPPGEPLPALVAAIRAAIEAAANAPRPAAEVTPPGFAPPAPEGAPVAPRGHDARLGAERLHGIGEAPLILQGGPGRDVILGGDGDDTLIGAAGDDLFSGGIGDDLILGGPGRDTIATGLFRFEARLDAARGELREPWGTDRFEGIERITFRDGVWVLCASEPAALAARLAEAILGRAAAPLELAAWTAMLEAGESGAALAARILAVAGIAAPDAELAARTATALADTAPLAAPLWVPDTQAVLVARFHHLVTGAAPDRDAFDLWAARVAALGPAAAAEAFLAAHPGSAHADGAALLAAAWAGTGGEAGVTLAAGWFL